MPLGELLKRTRKKQDDNNTYYTHVSLIKPRGRYQLELDDLETFWKVYHRALKENRAVGIAEISQNYIGAIFDIDLHQDIKPGEDFPSAPLYMPEDIITNIKLIVNSFITELDIQDEKVLTSVVLEKTGYVRGLQFRNGYHIQFPFLFVDKQWFGTTFLPRLAELVVGLDLQTASVPWLLYGSVKEENKRAYVVTSVYDSELRSVGVEALTTYPLYNSYGHPVVIHDVYMLLPQILSIIPHERKITHVRAVTFAPLGPAQLTGAAAGPPPSETVQESLDIAEKLLGMLSARRAEDRSTWIRIGWILHYHANGSDRGLQLWINFSRKCPDKFSESVCYTEWARMGIRFGLSLGTLFHWAAEDSPSRCEAFKQERREAVLSSYVVSSHYGIAKYLKHMYGHEFVCANITQNLWYQCVRGLWIRLDEPYTLRERLSEEVARDFNSLQTAIVKQMNRNIQHHDVALEEKTQAIKRLVQNLRSRPFKANVLAEAADKFFEPDFLRRLDSNPYVVGFQNGVFDLKTNNFRNFLPEDHISKRLPIDYTLFHPTDHAYCRLLDFLAKIFPDADVRRYFLDAYSEIFVGGNHVKHIYFWTGFGDNGKTVTQSLLERMLGNHAIKVATTLFSGKKVDTGAAAPELARAAPPVRLITLEEPDPKEELNIGYLKQFSGNDKFWARDLFQKGRDAVEITPFFKITFICNRLPKIRHADEATFNRIRVIPFESTFKPAHLCPSTVDEQNLKKIFPRNAKLLDELDDMAVALAFYLLQWRMSKKSDSLVEPLKVATATISYRERNDIYFQFFREMLVENRPALPALTEKDMFELFKLWFKSRRNSADISPEQCEFVHYLEYRWGDNRELWPRVSQADVREQVQSGKVILAGGSK